MTSKSDKLKEPNVSPYLLKPVRTFEEYLRDREIASAQRSETEERNVYSFSQRQSLPSESQTRQD